MAEAASWKPQCVNWNAEATSRKSQCEDHKTQTKRRKTQDGGSRSETASVNAQVESITQKLHERRVAKEGQAKNPKRKLEAGSRQAEAASKKPEGKRGKKVNLKTHAPVGNPQCRTRKKLVTR